MSTYLLQTTVTLFAITSVRMKNLKNLHQFTSSILHLQTDFIPGYFLLVVNVCQIFIPCLFGTFILIAWDRYFNELTRINWNLLSLEDQKSFSILLVPTINPKSITMVLKDLKLETFLEVRCEVWLQNLR
jgi:hypothetical protein